MIQRIQSLYLLAAATLMILFAFMPAAEVLAPDNQLFEIRMSGTYQILPEIPVLTGYVWWPMLILLAAIIMLYLAAIFLYKKRSVQMRLCILTMLLLIGLTGYMIYYIIGAFRALHAAEHSYKLIIILPFIALILTGLAFRAIRRDEELIRSVDRIR